MTNTSIGHFVGRAAPLMIDHIDTDQIIPSREIKSVGRSGLSEGLFAGWRYLASENRTPDPQFVLNKDGFSEADVLIAGRNFGCGSSREHAVWALKEFGIRAIVAMSFGEIFFDNCVRNGVLPIMLDALAVAEIADRAGRDPRNDITIDLPSQHVAMGDTVSRFEIGAYAKRLLQEGLDPIDLTLKDLDKIDAYERKDRAERPWIYGATV
ncbi:MAG: 3-isopropylmalate dehydratase small subunit [Pseudomonadota bacterium]